MRFAKVRSGISPADRCCLTSALARRLSRHCPEVVERRHHTVTCLLKCQAVDFNSSHVAEPVLSSSHRVRTGFPRYKRFWLLTDEPMKTNAQILSLIGDIYDTTFDQALWDDTLQRIVDYTGAQSCGLVTKSAAGEIRVGHQVGTPPHFLQTYLDHYGQFDPTHAIRLYDVGKIHSTEDWLPMEEFRKGQFYQEWLRPQRLEDAASVLLDNNADGFSYFCLMNGELVDDNLRRVLAPIVPHLLRAVLIGKTLHQQTRIASPIEHTLDELKAALFLLDATGNITHTNQSGHDILDRKDFLRVEQGRLASAAPPP